MFFLRATLARPAAVGGVALSCLAALSLPALFVAPAARALVGACWSCSCAACLACALAAVAIRLLLLA
ncbi:MAG TPA: hypothetical protein VD858_10210 [Reyranella sp.]|nr:hypothetical protein [Reyranella sp.]